MTLNYSMMMERYPNPEEEVGASISGCEISSMLDINLALACRPYVSKKKNIANINMIYNHHNGNTLVTNGEHLMVSYVEFGNVNVKCCCVLLVSQL